MLENGLSVFGSATIRVVPDYASIWLGVSRRTETPQDAFPEANTASAAVMRFLKQEGVENIRSSRVTLSQTSWKEREELLSGYVARIEHQFTTNELDLLDALLIGAIAAGANDLREVRFQTSELAEYRKDARTGAVAAARQKAELYAEAAGVSIVGVRAIEDVNPDGRPKSTPRGGPPAGGGAGDEPLDPGSIQVVGRVQMLFDIAPRD